jgi:hypothetical protein
MGKTRRRFHNVFDTTTRIHFELKRKKESQEKVCLRRVQCNLFKPEQFMAHLRMHFAIRDRPPRPIYFPKS